MSWLGFVKSCRFNKDMSVQLVSFHCWTLRPRYTHSSQVHRLHWSKPSTTWFNFNVAFPKGKASLKRKSATWPNRLSARSTWCNSLLENRRVKCSKCPFPTSRTQSPCCQVPPWCPPRPTCWGPKVCNGKLTPHYTYTTHTVTHAQKIKNKKYISRRTSYPTTYNYRPQSVKPLWSLVWLSFSLPCILKKDIQWYSMHLFQHRNRDVSHKVASLKACVCARAHEKHTTSHDTLKIQNIVALRLVATPTIRHDVSFCFGNLTTTHDPNTLPCWPLLHFSAMKMRTNLTIHINELCGDLWYIVPAFTIGPGGRLPPGQTLACTWRIW